MSYKIKSLLYFTCFLAAISMYYSMEHNIQNESFISKADLAKADMNGIASDNLMELKENK